MIRVVRSSFALLVSCLMLSALLGTFSTDVEAKKRVKSSKSSSSSKSRKSSRSTQKSSRSSKTVAARGRRGRPLTRRERLALARKQAEIRRRRELARLAAIARRRAADQALRDQALSNIAADRTVGEDLEVRRVAIEALGNHAGTVVVMNPKTGRVYSIVNQEWALRRGFKPCSTIKLVTGLAGVCEKVIDPMAELETASNRLDLTDSLAYSNNPYFQNVGGKVGFDRIMHYAQQMGLGEKTGINLPNESPGQVPFYKTGYSVNHMCSHGDDFEVTPIQLATLVSAIFNGGNLLTPFTPSNPNEDDSKFKPIVRRKLSIPQEDMRRLVPGMIGAVNYGTGKLAYDPVQTIAGKTGTCTGQGSWLGLFTSVGPVEDPNLAVVVVTRGSSERGKIAAGVAGKIYRALNHRFGKVNGQFVRAPQVVVPSTKLDPTAAAMVSDEDKEADDAERAEEEALSGDMADDEPSQQGGSKASTSNNGSNPNQQRPRRVKTP
jgi:penicillin-binding protein 2